MTMPAGERLDRLVAEALGQSWQGGNPIPGYDGQYPWPPPYSIDIAAAWKAWEAMLQTVGELSLLQDEEEVILDVSWRGPIWRVVAPTAPLAICRALLILRLEESTQ